MKKCPVCDVGLVGVEYEGFRVMQCESCGGHLVPLQRLESIKRIDERSEDELKAEATGKFVASTAEVVKCPRCRLPMRKQSADLPVMELETDVCRSCSLVWLDGGELALLQLAHQAKSRFINAQDLKRRMEQFEASPERKARFEENLSKCRDPSDPVAEAFDEVGDELLDVLLESLCHLTRESRS